MEQIKGKIKAIIFDMDGTIIKTEHIWKMISLDVLKHRGHTDLTQEQKDFLKTLSGKGMIHATTAIKEFFNLEDHVDVLVQEKIARANRYFQEQIEFIDGFEQFHDRLTLHQIPTSIATNACPENLKGLAEKLNFAKFFGTNIYYAAQVGKAKPDPALFLHAAAQLGVKPEECIVFEDSLPGFLAAQAAGMKCIAIKNELNGHLMDKVHGAIDSYHEAEEILKKI